jgi:nucleoside-diphosphate-sugar epimerase
MRLRSVKMSERVVLVTGALAGIGRATAAAFARQGATVVVSGRRDDEGKLFAAELRELGADAEYIRADVSIEDDVRALIDGTVKTFGKLDVAVNNAGFTGDRGQLATQTLEAYNAVFDTNVRGVFLSLKRQDWLAALDIVEALDPRAVVAGHKRYGNDDSPRILGETRQYISDFDQLDKETTTAEELYWQMMAIYPHRVNPGALWLSALSAKA